MAFSVKSKVLKTTSPKISLGNNAFLSYDKEMLAVSVTASHVLRYSLFPHKQIIGKLIALLLKALFMVQYLFPPCRHIK